MFTSQRSSRRDSGYALIEALVSMMVVAIGVLGIAKMQTVVVASSADAKARSEAMTFAQTKLDELRNIALQGEHYTNGGTCAAGSVVASGNDSRSGVNATYTRTWTVTPTCAPARHQILVTVGWTSAANESKNVRLNSVIAWNDPTSSTLKLAAGSGTGGGGVSPPATARLGDDAQDYGSLPGGATANGSDGTYTNYNSTSGEWEILVALSGGGYRVALYSKVPIVTLSGIVALDRGIAPDASGSARDDRTAADTLITNIAVYRTDITFCLFPLRFTSENDVSTYGAGGTTTSSDRAAAYKCYVPEGWTGNIGLLQRSYETGCSGKYNLFDGQTRVDSCDFRGDLACPGGNDGSANLFGVRGHKVLIVDGSGTTVGQSGVLEHHQRMLMPGYISLTRTQRLDFVIFKPVTSGSSRIETCSTRFSTTGSGTSGTSPANYTVFLRSGAGGDGVPSIVNQVYVIDRYLQGTSGGFITVSGTAGGSCGSSVTATGASGWGSFTCPVSGGNYSCDVSYGWSGTIGSASLTGVVANQTQNITCP